MAVSTALQDRLEKKFRIMNVSDIQVAPQVRKDFDQEELDKLAASISAVGMLEQPIVSFDPQGRCWLRAGERRLRAAKQLRMQTIAVSVVDFDANARVIQLAENAVRVGLNPIEEAQAIAELVQEGLTHEKISKAVGMSTGTIQARLDLLKLPSPVQEFVRTRAIGVGDALKLLEMPGTEADVIEAAQKLAAGERLSVLSTIPTGADDRRHRANIEKKLPKDPKQLFDVILKKISPLTSFVLAIVKFLELDLPMRQQLIKAVPVPMMRILHGHLVTLRSAVKALLREIEEMRPELRTLTPVAKPTGTASAGLDRGDFINPMEVFHPRGKQGSPHPDETLRILKQVFRVTDGKCTIVLSKTTLASRLGGTPEAVGQSVLAALRVMQDLWDKRIPFAKDAGRRGRQAVAEKLCQIGHDLGTREFQDVMAYMNRHARSG